MRGLRQEEEGEEAAGEDRRYEATSAHLDDHGHAFGDPADHFPLAPLG